MQKEIILPHHLYQRIKASAGEHGGIGAVNLFDGEHGEEGAPLCAHGHAWGTCTRFQAAERAAGLGVETYEEPELARFISWADNDTAIPFSGPDRIPFDEWCRRLNVRCGPQPVELRPQVDSGKLASWVDSLSEDEALAIEASGTAKESFANYVESLP